MYLLYLNERPIDIPPIHAPPQVEPGQDTPFQLLSKEEQKRQHKEEKERIKRAKEEEKRRKKEEEKERKRIEKERKSKKGKAHIGQEWDQAVNTAVRTEVYIPPVEESPERVRTKRMSSFEENKVSRVHDSHLSSEGEPDDYPSDKETEAADDNDDVDDTENQEVTQSRVGEEFDLLIVSNNNTEFQQTVYWKKYLKNKRSITTVLSNTRYLIIHHRNFEDEDVKFREITFIIIFGTEKHESWIVIDSRQIQLMLLSESFSVRKIDFFRTVSDQRSRRNDPSGAIPRTSAVRQPSSSVSSSEQFYTGREERSDSLRKPSPDSTSSSFLPKLSREEFIHQHYEKLPKELKVGYYDVMVLYSEADYQEAEYFRAHLEKDIFPNEPGKIKAVLYDGPELEGLSASKLQHLDSGFQRCTFTFVYLTKQFVECDWCSLSSETCLMEAIYNKDKKWCVVPVYTVQRNKAEFRVPMGLNSLKGINFYNADEFYCKGVRRLIGDKIYKRIENDKKHQESCYNYLVKKVQEDDDYDRRLLAEHEHKQRVMEMKRIESDREWKEYYRSQSMKEQSERNVVYASGGGYPKTAGNMAYPPPFPTQFTSKAPTEGDDTSSLKSQSEKQKIGDEMNLKPDIPSSLHSTDYQQKYGPSESGPSSRTTGPTSMDAGDLTGDYQSAPPHPNAQSRPGHLPKSEVNCSPSNQPSGIHIHYHQYYNPAKQEQEQSAKTYNITADNVIIGDKGKILLGGQQVDMEEFRGEVGSKDSVPSMGSMQRRRSDQGMPSSVSADVGFPTNQSSDTSAGRLQGNSNPTEHEDKEITCVQNVPTVLKETEAKLGSADSGSTSLKTSDTECTNLKGQIQKPENKKISTEKENFLYNIPPKESNISKLSNKIRAPSSRPIKPFTANPASSPLIALVPPVKSSYPVAKQRQESSENESDSESTVLKQPVASEQTVSKVTSSRGSEQTLVKTPLGGSPLGQTSGSNVDPDDTEVLKPVRRPNDSVSSLETDGSTEDPGTVLTKDDLEIQAVQQSLEMGYTQEQVRDALTLLRQRRPDHHHFSINEMLDALTGRTTREAVKQNDRSSGEENWVTVEKDKSGECHEMEPPTHNNHVSQPKSIRTSSSNPELSKSKQDKNKCKMS
ncbi:unnamed protein product [Mytilus coruscus]|uniref:TIR domain-containing protein n=1 Tax=Mytilus coruscus TaxID=42192 RepID=A0A6J8B4E5_MYTCO|nr:unnamed protein product [Mytilus coruscus]